VEEGLKSPQRLQGDIPNDQNTLHGPHLFKAAAS
jgi:hypothetical protein